MSNIFKEALADAKKLREVAEDNAKKVIIESVTPQIREFIEEQLLESTQENISENHDFIDANAIADMVKMLGIENNFQNLNKNEEKHVFEKAIKTAVSKLSESNQKKINHLANNFNKKDDNLDSTKINNNVDDIKENNSMSREKYYEIDLQMLREAVEEEKEALEMSEKYHDMDEEEISEEYGEGMEDDDAVLKELSYLLEQEDDAPEDLSLDDEEEEDSEDSEELPADLELPEDDAMEGGEDLEGDSIAKSVVKSEIEEMMRELGLTEDEEDIAADLPEVEEAPIEEVFDVDPNMLREELANIRRQLSEGSVDHHFGGKGGSKAGHQNAFGGSGAKKAGHQKSFGGGTPGKDPFVNPPQINKLNEAIRKLKRVTHAQEEKLNKYRSAVITLREQLEDLNLFNAKLLYVNKLLQNKGLTESQKKSVIKALDEAKNLGETKALYKSLTESLASSKKSLNESTKLGSSSRVTTSATSTSNSSGANSSRWQLLAGLK